MKLVIQRVLGASLSVGGRTVSETGKGVVVYLGVGRGDGERECGIAARKIASLRIFSDEAGKMNLSLSDVGGEALIVSQFTLLGDARKGNRPSFIESAPPKEANSLYEAFCSALSENGVRKVEKGVFGAHMEVSLLNNGPVTILYDTDTWKGKA